MTEEVKKLSSLIYKTSQEGRQTLVVMGAGCSVAAGVPQMHQVYQYLYQKVADLLTRFPDKHQAKELAAWLNALRAGAGPRSAAARALGTLQLAHELTRNAFNVEMQRIWHNFSTDFIACRISLDAGTNVPHAPRNGGLSSIWEESSTTPSLLDLVPTQFHDLVAQWVIDGYAVVVGKSN